MPAAQQSRARRVPQRICIACRSSEAKRGLVRLVRTPVGGVEIDRTGKKNGRGAYVHDDSRCWNEALKKDRLGRALKVSVASADRMELEHYAARLMEQVQQKSE